MPKVTMPTCPLCDSDEPVSCPCCKELYCRECTEATSMGCVHRKRIREVTNPDWVIIDEATEFTPGVYDRLRSRLTGRIISGFD